MIAKIGAPAISPHGNLSAQFILTGGDDSREMGSNGFSRVHEILAVVRVHLKEREALAKGEPARYVLQVCADIPFLGVSNYTDKEMGVPPLYEGKIVLHDGLLFEKSVHDTKTGDWWFARFKLADGKQTSFRVYSGFEILDILHRELLRSHYVPNIPSKPR